MKARDVRENIPFTYKGKVYKWMNKSEFWKQLADKDGNIIPPQEIPSEIILNQVDVILGENNDTTAKRNI